MMSTFTLSVVADYVLRNRVKFNVALGLLKARGIHMQREPMGLTFWDIKTGKRLHGEFNI